MMFFSTVAYAHSGKTDSSGGHYDHSSGEYHYHHGYSAHSHYDMDGDGDIDCPYNFEDKTNHDNTSNNDSDTEHIVTGSKPSVKTILKKIFSIIGFSILAALVGLSSGILIILYSLLMAPIEALIKRRCNKDSQSELIDRFGTIVKILMAIAIVVAVTAIVIH